MRNTSRSQRLKLNSLSSIAYQVIAIICGLILPRLYILSFGSEVNGLMSSISQFLGFIALADCGIGAVVQSSLYKPIAEKDNDEISRIMISTRRFYRRLCIVLLIYVAVLIYAFPLIASSTLEPRFVSALVAIISISIFAQYFISMPYRMLLNADQLGYVVMLLQIVSLVLNTIVCAMMMLAGYGVEIVRLAAALMFLIQPIGLLLYVKKHYKLDRKIELHGEPIKQKWNGLSQHVASVILDKTDVVVLTCFSTLSNVSVYSVYYMVIYGIFSLIQAATNGLQAFWGDMYAKAEHRLLSESFNYYEWLIHFCSTIMFACTGLLIVPFVCVYTSGVSDANYILPGFAAVISAAYFLMSIRLPYLLIVKAAGHYKQTQLSAVVEAALNVAISVGLVFRFGLIGIAVGTLIAMVYRTGYFVLYLSKNILQRPAAEFFKMLMVDLLGAAVSVVLCAGIVSLTTTITDWIILAILVLVIVVAVSAAINFLFQRNNLKRLLNSLLRRS